MRFIALCLPLFVATAVSAEGPPLKQELEFLSRLNAASLGKADFEEGLEVLGWMYDTQLKGNPELLEKEVPIDYRDSKEAFLRYARFWLSSRFEIRRSVRVGSSYNDFYFIDRFGVWNGKFSSSYTIPADGIENFQEYVEFTHPLTRQTIHVNYRQGEYAGPNQDVLVRYGRFEDSEYASVKVSLVTGELADQYVNGGLIDLIRTRTREALDGRGHPDLAPKLRDVLKEASKLKRPDVASAARTALEQLEGTLDVGSVVSTENPNGTSPPGTADTEAEAAEPALRQEYDAKQVELFTKRMKQYSASYRIGRYDAADEHLASAIRLLDELEVPPAAAVRVVLPLRRIELLVKLQRPAEALQVIHGVRDNVNDAVDGGRAGAEWKGAWELLHTYCHFLHGQPHYPLPMDAKNRPEIFANYQDREGITYRSAAFISGLQHLCRTIPLLKEGGEEFEKESIEATKRLTEATVLFEDVLKTHQKDNVGTWTLGTTEAALGMPPVQDRQVEEAAGQIYFYHALACTLRRDFDAAEKSRQRLRKLAPEWGLVNIDKATNPNDWDSHEGLKRKWAPRLASANLAFDDPNYYLSDCYGERANVHLTLSQYPEAVLDYVAAYVTYEFKFKQDLITPEFRRRLDGRKDGILRRIANMLAAADAPSGDGFHSGTLAMKFMGLMVQTNVAARTQALARCGRYDVALAVIAEDLQKDPPHPPVLHRAGSELYQPGVFSSDDIEAYLRGQPVCRRGDEHLSSRGLEIKRRERDWTDEERVKLTKAGFPKWMVEGDVVLEDPLGSGDLEKKIEVEIQFEKR